MAAAPRPKKRADPLVSPDGYGVGREVPMPPLMAEVLREHRKAMIKGQHRGLKTGLVFPSKAGTHRDGNSLSKVFRLVERTLTMDIRVTPQVLRRTFNTLLVQAGVDRIVLRSVMGHSSEAMTRRYAGVGLEAKVEAVSLLIGKKGGQGS